MIFTEKHAFFKIEIITRSIRLSTAMWLTLMDDDQLLPRNAICMKVTNENWVLYTSILSMCGQ